MITHVFGNNTYTKTVAQMIHSDGSDRPEWRYPITVAPGQTKIVVLFNVLTAGLNYDTTYPAPEIALGAQLAKLITNNGAPIAADSVPFAFFTGMTRDQLMEVINFNFVGLTIDTSRPSFIQTDFAVAQPSAIFDGGTLKPTTATIFNQNFVVHSTGGTIDSSNGNLTIQRRDLGRRPADLYRHQRLDPECHQHLHRRDQRQWRRAGGERLDRDVVADHRQHRRHPVRAQVLSATRWLRAVRSRRAAARRARR